MGSIHPAVIAAADPTKAFNAAGNAASLICACLARLTPDLQHEVVPRGHPRRLAKAIRFRTSARERGLGISSKRSAELAAVELQLAAKRFVEGAREAIRINDPRKPNPGAFDAMFKAHRHKNLLNELDETDRPNDHRLKPSARSCNAWGRSLDGGKRAGRHGEWQAT
jgi:hypothetical protein